MGLRGELNGLACIKFLIYISFFNSRFIISSISNRREAGKEEERRGAEGRVREGREGDWRGEEERKENMVPMPITQFRAPFFNEVWLGEKGY